MSDALFWKVEVDAAGTTYDLAPDLSTFSIEEEDRSPTLLTLELSDPFLVFGHALREGVAITVDLGTEDDHSLVFRGRIYHVDVGLPQDGTPAVTLKAYDASMVMGLRKRSRRFRDMHLSEIVTKVTEPHFKGPPVKPKLLGDPLFKGEGLRQRDETDLCFLRRLAEQTQCAMGIRLGKDGKDDFVFLSQNAVLKSAPNVVLHYGRCDVPNRLLTFNGQVDVGDIAVPRTIAAMDPKTGDVIDPRDTTLESVGRAEDRLRDENLAAFQDEHPDRADKLKVFIKSAEKLDAPLRKELGKTRCEPVAAFATLDQVSEHGAQQQSASLFGMQASGSTVGNKNLHVRTALGIEGGGRFSGNWFISKATHTFDRQGYRTDFTCQR